MRSIAAGARWFCRAATAVTVSGAAVGRCVRHESGSSTKLWGGRFTGKTDPLMEKFNNSIGFDKRLWRADITGSIAYAKALARCGILTTAEADSLVHGLGQVCGDACSSAADCSSVANGRHDCILETPAFTSTIRECLHIAACRWHRSGRVTSL